MVVEDSYATGQVIGSSDKIGGLIGYAFGNTIRDSYAKGNVSGIESVGGFVGEANGGSISRCYATGLVSQASADISLGFFGGLVGFADANITSSTASGGVSALDFDDVGGLVGYLASAEGEVNSSYATGVVTGVGLKVGALVGDNFNCLNPGLPSYWLDPTGSTVGVGLGPTLGASGLLPPDMLMQSSFVGFAFPGTWLIIEGQTRPYLVWQPPPLLIFSDGFETSP